MVGNSGAWAVWRIPCRDVKGLFRASSHLIFSMALNCAEPILVGHYENLSHRQCFSGVFKDYQSQFNLIVCKAC